MKAVPTTSRRSRSAKLCPAVRLLGYRRMVRPPREEGRAPEGPPAPVSRKSGATQRGEFGRGLEVFLSESSRKGGDSLVDHAPEDDPGGPASRGGGSRPAVRGNRSGPSLPSPQRGEGEGRRSRGEGDAG